MTSALPAGARGVGVAGTTVAHGALIALALFTANRSARRGPVVYQVNLVAAPAPSAGAKTSAATTPAPKPTAPPPKPKAAKPAPKTPPAQVKRSEPVPAAKNPVVPALGEKPSTGQSPVTIHQEGLPFPYQEYLDNLVAMVYKRWNHAGFRPGLEVRIAFVISKDGSVDASSYGVDKSSHDNAFDEAGRAAIEAVSAHREFGPLPTGFTGASLPILFVFTQVRPGQP
jgi:outer membrane biosynthesis protein TonB